MGLLHVPRVAAACARGYFLRSTGSSSISATPGAAAASSSKDSTPPRNMIGLVPSNPHTYTGRVGLFDIDGFAHMNTAAYLVHAELARWQMSAENGSLDTMISQRCAFLVTGLAVRYRREVGPLFQKFQINTFVGGLDDRSLWLYHTFHYLDEESGEQGPVLAQILLQSVVTQNFKVMEPSKYLADIYGADESVIHQLRNMHEDVLFMEKRSKFGDLEDTMRASAAATDAGERRRG